MHILRPTSVSACEFISSFDFFIGLLGGTGFSSTVVSHARIADFFTVHLFFPTFDTILDWLLAENEDLARQYSEQLKNSPVSARDKVDFLTGELGRLKKAREAFLAGIAIIFIQVTFGSVDFWIDTVNLFYLYGEHARHKVGGVFLNGGINLLSTRLTFYMLNDFSGILKSGRGLSHAHW